MKYLIWVNAEDCDPPHSLDMSSKHDADKVCMLVGHFSLDGFDTTKPALVGYPKDGRIQLLSGTHRHMAALMTNTKLPVTLWLRSYVERAWGTEHWLKLISDLSVDQLLSMGNVDQPDLLSVLADPVEVNDFYR